MNHVEIFKNPEFGSVRVVEIDGEPWLVGKDVALALGYATILASEDRTKELRQPRSSVREHLKQEPKRATPKTLAHKKKEPER